jgi:hypothetical protein
MMERGEIVSIWLRYLAITVLIGNGFTALWNLIALGRTIRLGSFGDGIGLVALNVVISFAAITLAALIAAPARRGVSLGTKAIAVLSTLGGGFGVLCATLWLYALMAQPQNGLSMDARDAFVEGVTMERVLQNAFFSACTFVLAILILASRRMDVERAPSP